MLRMSRMWMATRPWTGKAKGKVDLKSLREAFKEAEVKAIVEQAPTGVSSQFFSQHQAISRHLAAKTASSNMFPECFNLIKTQEEADMWKALVVAFRTSRNLIGRSEASKMINVLLKANQLEMIHEFLSNKYLYAIYPAAKNILNMMLMYSKVIPENSIDLSQLHMMYKCFLYFMYYEIPPTVAHYELLINSGAYHQSPDALRLSQVTADEVKALGWELPASSVYALIYSHLKQGNVPSAKLHLDSCQADTLLHTLQFKLESLLMENKPVEAVDVFGELITSEQEDVDILGNSNWNRLDGIIPKLQKAVEDLGDLQVSEKLTSFLTSTVEIEVPDLDIVSISKVRQVIDLKALKIKRQFYVGITDGSLQWRELGTVIEGLEAEKRKAMVDAWLEKDRLTAINLEKTSREKVASAILKNEDRELAKIERIESREKTLIEEKEMKSVMRKQRKAEREEQWLNQMTLAAEAQIALKKDRNVV